MHILNQVEQSLNHFRPKTPGEYVALQIARRFNDTPDLAKYLLAARSHSKRELLHAAAVARTRHELNRAPLSTLFFEVLAEKNTKGGSAS
jgi:hypothetical protein